MTDGAGTLELSTSPRRTPGATSCAPGTSSHDPPAAAWRMRSARPRGYDAAGLWAPDSRDACFYPRSQKLSIRGLGVIMRVERVDYWNGEA